MKTKSFLTNQRGKTQAFSSMGSFLIATDLLLASMRTVVQYTKQAQALHSCLIKGRVFLEIKKLSDFYRVDSQRL